MGFSSFHPIFFFFGKKYASYDLTVCVGHLTLSNTPHHAVIFPASDLFPRSPFPPSVGSIWLTSSLRLLQTSRRHALAKVLIFVQKPEKALCLSTPKRGVFLKPRWTALTHLRPPRVWSALCLLLGKTVELGREKPDRMKPALPLSDPFKCWQERPKCGEKNENESSWVRLTIFRRCYNASSSCPFDPRPA